MLTRVRSKSLARATRPDKEARRRAVEATVAMAGDKLKSFLKLVDLLEDNDDVQNVYHNADYDEPED